MQQYLAFTVKINEIKLPTASAHTKISLVFELYFFVASRLEKCLQTQKLFGLLHSVLGHIN